MINDMEILSKCKTSKELAQKIGLVSSTIGRYESGEIQKHKIPVLDSIAKALLVNPDWICCISDQKYLIETHQPSSQDRILSYFFLLNHDGRKLLLERAEELVKLGYTNESNDKGE